MLFSIMNIVNWEFIGYNMIIIYAALRSLPSELYEAARVDGASNLGSRGRSRSPRFDRRCC